MVTIHLNGLGTSGIGIVEYILFYDSLRFFIYNVHNICSQALTGAIRVHLISIIKKKKLIAGSTKQK